MAEPDNSRDPFQLCGSTIEGKYRVVDVIGDGGFGVVYRGEHMGFGEHIAIKCLKLPAELGEKQRTELLEQLREEGRLLHRLSRATSGIVQALDVGAFVTKSGTWVPYLVLEWLEGETLGELLKRREKEGQRGMSVAEALVLLEPAARALAVAHGQKIAHRDVKPANLFVTTVGGQRTMKVLDFGIAKVLTEHASFTEALAATRQGPTAFTPRYGAPEQFNKQRGATGPWTDVFALGLIFVEMVSGRKALEGDDPTELYIIAADPSMRPTPRARGADVTEAIERVIAKALNVEPKHRFPDAGAFWEALAAAAQMPTAATATAAARTSSPDNQTSPVRSEDISLLSTAEYAQRQSLGVSAEAATRMGSNPALGRTEHATNQRASAPSNAGEPPWIPPTSVPTGGSAPLPPTHRGDRDPMAETPMGARVPTAAPQQPTSGGAAAPLPPTAAPNGPQPAAPKKGLPVWPFLLGALLIGGGALGYTLLTMGTPTKKPGKPGSSASPTANARNTPAAGPRASAAAPGTSASAAPVASASAGVPFTVPRDMAFLAPMAGRLGEGADAREVTISRGFYIDLMEVTTQQYRACVAQGKCPGASQVVLPPESATLLMVASGADPDTPQDPKEFAKAWSVRCNEPRSAVDHPINCVTYAAAQSYCAFRGRRLPTEAEWEFAARGGALRPFAWGDDAPTCARACYDRNGTCLEGGEGVTTCPAGGRPRDRTPEGLYDLGGNVAEWVADGYASPPPAGTDPFGPTSVSMRVVRGASFLDPADHVRASFRTGVVPTTAHVTIGFRCAMDGPPPEGEAPEP
ncbi:bifunctional serine/threonine-protein kinase/formylglycine-generating enzyme family protein [Polyangium aurulentum]|uniref:bifunctional serine/threonine-protein kinase/formylglycine-generating enzyme family protein n=1 Tax=Polyangium aurulentum TaxID=2567896 RepID=UPI0010ADE90F|nr:bifunctional serine/threonine-protein kinase/formylglycine-generating enzyme family protein [Polyangium aurulentum]UQA63302.1 SUMF1/EgtB/PvdO family nonheme iron enzyme [Polyangium aurulentum]